MLHSFAQNHEDVLLHRCFADKPSGFYVDIGAAAPVLHSVSLNFYISGWRGLNVEPIPERAAELRWCRPRDIVVEAAASDAAGVVTFHRTAGAGGLSSLTNAYLRDVGADDMWPISVEARPLADILAEHQVGAVDFLKIDVEGAEAQVIAGMDWRRWRPAVLVIEAVTPTRPPEPNHQVWEPALLAEGYAFVYFDGLNRYYLSDGALDLKPHFDRPPCPFDAFRRFEDFGEPLLNRAHPNHEVAVRTAKMLLRQLAGGRIDFAAAFMRDLAPNLLEAPATVAHAQWAIRQALAREPRAGEAQALTEARPLTVRGLIEELLAGEEFRIACAAAAA